MTPPIHTPEQEIWSTGPLSGEVQSNVPQYEGQQPPYLVCSGGGNSEAVALIAKAPALARLCGELEMDVQGLQLKVIELKDLLNRAYPYLHDLQSDNGNDPTVGIFEDAELTDLYTTVKNLLGK